MTAAITGMVISTAGAAYGASQANKAASKSRKWQKRAIEENRRQFDQTREDWAPWREAGGRAIDRLEDPNAFTTSPAYNFIRDEGMRNIENRYSIRGGGGNAMKALTDWNKNNAATEYWNWRNDQRAMAGLGTTGNMASQRAGDQYVANYGRSADNMGSLAMWQANQNVNAMNAGLSGAMYGAYRMAGAQQPTGGNAMTNNYWWNKPDPSQPMTNVRW